GNNGRTDQQGPCNNQIRQIAAEGSCEQTGCKEISPSTGYRSRQGLGQERQDIVRPTSWREGTCCSRGEISAQLSRGQLRRHPQAHHPACAVDGAEAQREGVRILRDPRRAG